MHGCTYKSTNCLHVFQSFALTCAMKLVDKWFYVINMPWYKLCLIDVLYRMATLTIQRLPNALKVVPFLTCAVNIYSPNGGTCFALGLVKTH